ncbi:MAG TPA: sugar phosphate isomerase/epimerase family protein [Tepidisphaeraceae bacterium]|nr:sugar phosphate isomerase/epimerase family protein [Tepidisphaeraceae bacterium]
MKFAFSTVACPKWDFETIAARAKEYGYEGVEIRGFLNEAILPSANIFLSDPAKITGIFASQGVEIACLSSSIAMTGNRKSDLIQAGDCKRFIDTAAELDCPLVKIFDREVRPGSPFNPMGMGFHSRGSAGIELGDWLLPLGDYAAERNVTIVIENALSFRSAKEMWLILDRLSHPSIACCWDVCNAAMIGEPPSVSVPFLNSRIQYVQVKDAKLGPLGANFCKLGEGDVQVRKLLIRLMGIGYSGWVTMEWEKAWLVNLAEPEEILPDSIKKLQEWTKPPEKEKPAAKKPAAAAH